MGTTSKPWWQSKTIWVQVIAFIFAIGAGKAWWPADLTQESVLAWVMGAVAFVNVVLRFVTKSTIGSS